MKTSREGQTRAHERRDLPINSNPFSSALDYPPGTYREGYRAKFVRVGDGSNVEDAVRKGYEPIPKERVTGRKAISSLFTNNRFSNEYYTYKDTILMEIPEVLAEQIENNTAKTTENRLRSLKGVKTTINGSQVLSGF